MNNNKKVKTFFFSNWSGVEIMKLLKYEKDESIDKKRRKKE